MADYIRLFDGETQGTGSSASIAFRTDDGINAAKFMLPSLRIVGSLDSGTLKLQTLDPSVDLVDADNAVDSDDWVNTDDTIAIPSLYVAPVQRLWFRLLATNLGASANFTVDLILNKL